MPGQVPKNGHFVREVLTFWVPFLVDFWTHFGVDFGSIFGRFWVLGPDPAITTAAPF